MSVVTIVSLSLIAMVFGGLGKDQKDQNIGMKAIPKSRKSVSAAAALLMNLDKAARSIMPRTFDDRREVLFTFKSSHVSLPSEQRQAGGRNDAIG